MYTDDDDDNHTDDGSGDAFANEKDGNDDDKVDYDTDWLLGWVKKPNICICS